jgi:diguanylate cyclase (GGDEF)-like protein
MPQKKAANFLVAGLFFVGLSWLLFARRDLAAAVFPAYGLLFFWCDGAGQSELVVLFLVLSTGAGISLARSLEGPAAIAVGLDTAGLWILSWALSESRGALGREEARLAAEADADLREIKEAERGLDYYRSRHREAAARIQLRRDMAQSAKILGRSLSREEVFRKLGEILGDRFPGAAVEFKGEEGADPFLRLSAASRRPLLVSDAAADERLRGAEGGVRSAMVLPLRVSREPAGYVKISSPKPAAFSEPELKGADLLATLAGLSLENIILYERIRSQAVHDALTQLYSRKAFDERLHEEVLRAGRTRLPLSLVMIDIDHFKSYNDRYGHQAGDELLKRVSSVLFKHIRDVDMAARYGGEEFCLLLPQLPYAEAYALAESARQAISREVFVFKGEASRVTVSLGVAVFPEDAAIESQFVRAADERLYRAKHAGRNRTQGR